MGVMTRVDPVGELNENRLFQNIGLDHWLYEGEPEKGYVNHNGKIVAVWLFDYTRISTPEVKAHMVRSRMVVDGMSPYEAIQICLNNQQGFPCDEIRLTKIEE